MSTDAVRTESDTFCYAVLAAADPGTLPRLLAPFAKRGLLPSSVVARTGAGGLTQRVDLQVPGLDAAGAEVIAEIIRQMVTVERVLVAALAASEAA